MIGDTRLTDGFVLLRPYRTGDAEQLHAAATESMAKLTPYLPWVHDGYSLQESKEWVASRHVRTGKHI